MWEICDMGPIRVLPSPNTPLEPEGNPARSFGGAHDIRKESTVEILSSKDTVPSTSSPAVDAPVTGLRSGSEQG